ncbi:hypothetical protein EIN_318960, partial [Entamoeba invadens IP1]
MSRRVYPPLNTQPQMPNVQQGPVGLTQPSMPNVPQYQQQVGGPIGMPTIQQNVPQNVPQQIPQYQQPVYQQPPQQTLPQSVPQQQYPQGNTLPLQQNIVGTQQQQQPAQAQTQENKNVEQNSMPAPTLISSVPTSYNMISPPPSNLQPFTAAVDNKSSPKNIRLSVFTPSSKVGLQKQLSIPLSCEITPFAKMFPGEKLDSIKADPKNIKRCPRCGGYVNPFCAFEEGGKKM